MSPAAVALAQRARELGEVSQAVLPVARGASWRAERKQALHASCACWGQVTRLDFLPEHAESYNQLVEVVERNLLLADWRDENHEESMLHVKRGVWGAQMLQNLRRARPVARLLRQACYVRGTLAPGAARCCFGFWRA